MAIWQIQRAKELAKVEEKLGREGLSERAMEIIAKGKKPTYSGYRGIIND